MPKGAKDSDDDLDYESDPDEDKKKNLETKKDEAKDNEKSRNSDNKNSNDNEADKAKEDDKRKEEDKKKDKKQDKNHFRDKHPLLAKALVLLFEFAVALAIAVALAYLSSLCGFSLLIPAVVVAVVAYARFKPFRDFLNKRIFSVAKTVTVGTASKLQKNIVESFQGVKEACKPNHPLVYAAMSTVEAVVSTINSNMFAPLEQKYNLEEPCLITLSFIAIIAIYFYF